MCHKKRRNTHSAFFLLIFIKEIPLADFIFKISPNITLGSYTIARLGQFAKDWGTRYMLILDPALKDFDINTKIEASLKDRSIEYFTFDDISDSSDTTTVERALKLAREAHVHGIICAGGTRAGNVARATASLYNEMHSIFDYIDGAAPTTAALPFIAIPTSMRDSFLFTTYSPITDSRSNKAKLLKLQNGLCKLALFDPNLILNHSQNKRTSIGLRTLCIAIEAYISQKSNFFSDTILEKAIDLTWKGLDTTSTVDTATSQEVSFAQGGCMTSFGSALSSLGQASLVSLAIESRYKIDASLTTTILLPYIIEEASKYKGDKLAQIAFIMGLSNNPSDIQTNIDALLEEIRTKIALANLPARLKELSVSIEQLALCAEDAGALEIMNGLSRSMTSDDLFELIKQAY